MVATQMPSRQVLALPGGAQWAHRRVRLNEWVRERFWSIPLALVLAGVLVAAVVSRPGLLGLPADWDLGHIVRVSTANTLLQVMASSMLTFVGVVFAITLVGLQLASAQLSPGSSGRSCGRGHQDRVRSLPGHLRLRRHRDRLRQR